MADVRRPGWYWKLSLLVFCGCATYQVGTQSLYPTDVATVYVPVFESDSFRRNLGERLTEAVIKEIEQKTPYKVVGSANADSILSGRLTDDSKRVLVENRFDDAREIEVDFHVQVTWINRRGDLIRDPQMIPLPPALVEIGQTATLVPEGGQSIVTAQQEVIDQLAQRIVALMEVPW